MTRVVTLLEAIYYLNDNNDNLLLLKEMNGVVCLEPGEFAGKAFFVSENWEWFEKQVDMARIDLTDVDGGGDENDVEDLQPTICKLVGTCNIHLVVGEKSIITSKSNSSYYMIKLYS